MKTFCTCLLLAVLTLNLSSCASPEERKRRRAERDREDAQWEADRQKRDREFDRRDAEDFDAFLVRYARGLGKSVSQLTPNERADARDEYRDSGSHWGRRHFWY